MTQPLRKTLEDMAFELRGIKHVLIKHVALTLQKR
jgi:hypothetical protein